MRAITKRIAVVLACLLLTMVMGCSSGVLDCGGHGLVVLVLNVGNSTSTQVGVPLQLSVQTGVMSNGTVGELHSLPEWGKAGLTWTVQSSDGATISSAGVFKATKPGDYLVTVSLEVGDQDDPATDWTRVTVTEAETTTTEATEAESTTTETTVANSYAGTYKGTMPLTIGAQQVDVPWGFTVDDEGSVRGGLDYTFVYEDVPGETVLTFTGQVSDDGRLTASGTGTTTYTPEAGPQSTSNAVSLSGQISGATFTGTWAGEGGKTSKVTAKRQ